MSMFDGLRELPELRWLYFQKFSSFDGLLRELPSLPQNGATIRDLERLREAMKDHLSIGEQAHKLATKPACELFDLSLWNRLYLGAKNLLELSPDMETEFRRGIETLTGAIKEKLVRKLEPWTHTE
jgi:hypothetical protein